MPQAPNRAIIYLIGDKDSRVATSIEEGERVAAHLKSGAEHSIEVRRHHDGARVVIRTAAIASVVFLHVEESRAQHYGGSSYVSG